MAEPRGGGGYARAHRGRWDHPLFRNKQEAAVWAWMTDTARFRAHSFQTKFGSVTLERGQLLVSERGIAEDFGLHKNTVRRLLQLLIDHNMISVNRDHGASRAGTIAAITNYERYQGDSGDEQPARDHGRTANRTKAGPRRDQGGTTREEREKGEEREEGDSPSDLSVGDPPEPPVTRVAKPVAVDDAGEALAGFQAVRLEINPAAGALRSGPERRKKLLARLAEIGGLAEWNVVLAKIRGSPFLRGETSKWAGGVPIDWLLEPKNLTKVLEGNYDGRPRAAGQPAGPVVPGPTISALCRARAAAGLGGPFV